MNNKYFTIQHKCFFCNTPLERESNKEYNSGDMIKCQSCQELNDYDSLVEVAKEEGKRIAKEEGIRIIKENLGNKMKNIFKK